MATFSVILDSCLVCDGRRVEPTDLVDLYLDTTKFPSAENPIRAVVLDVRAPEPPETVLGKVALDVQVSDADMPDGVTILEPDDLDYVKCVDCCVRNTERIEELEEKIIGTQETSLTPFPPFIPSTFTFAWSGGSVPLMAYSGMYGGYPYFTVGTHTIRREGNSWVWINTATATTYTQDGQAGYLPWLGESNVWRAAGAFNVTLTYSAYIPSTTSVPPTEIDPDMEVDDLLFVSTPEGEIYFWDGTHWERVVGHFNWSPAADPTATTPPLNSRTLIRATTSGMSAAVGIYVYAGDYFVRNPTAGATPALIRLGISGTFINIGVTTNGDQTITGKKNWLFLQTFADVDINGGNIDGTIIGSAFPTIGKFTNIEGLDISLGSSFQDGRIFVSRSSVVGGARILIEPNYGIVFDRTHRLPDGDGTYVLSNTRSDGVLPFSEVGGIVMGKMTISAGAGTTVIPNGTGSSHIVGLVSELQSGTAGHLTAFMSDSELWVQSTSATDVRTIFYTIFT